MEQSSILQEHLLQEVEILKRFEQLLDSNNQNILIKAIHTLDKRNIPHHQFEEYNILDF